MNGRYLLDTNAVIALLKGSKKLLTDLTEAQWIGISVMSKLEFLAFPGIASNEKKLFYDFIQRVSVIDLRNDEDRLINSIIVLRKKHNIKLPDAVIAASAFINNSSLVTNDKEFDRINEISIINF